VTTWELIAEKAKELPPESSSRCSISWSSSVHEARREMWTTFLNRRGG